MQQQPPTRMPTAHESLVRDDPAGAALLHAMDAPADLRSIALVFRFLAAVLGEAEDRLQLPRVGDWRRVAAAMEGRFVTLLHDPANPQLGVTAYSPEAPRRQPYAMLVLAATQGASGAQHADAISLLGLVLCTAASRRWVIPQSVAAGFSKLLRASAAGTNDWSELQRRTPLSASDAQAVSAHMRTEVARDFCRAIGALLLHPVRTPQARGTAVEALPDTGEPTASLAQGEAGVSAGTVSSAAVISSVAEEEGEGDEVADADAAPSVGGLVHAALVAPWAQKMGSPGQWNCLSPESTRAITQKLAAGMASDQPERRLVDALLTLSLILSKSPKLTLRTAIRSSSSTDTEASIWIQVTGDPRDCHMCWSLAALRASMSTAPADTDAAPDDDGAATIIGTSSSRDLVLVPLPEPLAMILAACWAARPSAKTVADLLDFNEQPLRKVHEHLLSIGDRAHPATPARFAASLGLVYLHLTHSDMAAAMCALHFSMVPSSALFYFQPSQAWVGEQARAVYRWLGLAADTASEDARAPTLSGRCGAGTMPSGAELRAGWQRLHTDIVERVQALQHAKTPIERCEQLNSLTAQLGAAFVLWTAHRGSKLERLTWGCLTQEAAILSDKQTDGERSSRLVPLCAVTDAVVRLAAQLEHRHFKGGAESLRWDQPVFRLAKVVDGQVRPAEPLVAQHVAEVIVRYFRVSVNVGRHAWITHLGERKVDRWLIRALTGHGSHRSQAYHAACLVAPHEGLSALRGVMNVEGALLFGPIDKLVSTVGRIKWPDVDWRGFRCSQALGPPQRLAEALPIRDVPALARHAWACSARDRLLAEKGDLAPAPRLLLSLLMIDCVPLQHARAALRDLSFFRQVGHAIGLTWKRAHYHHPTWQPIQPPTALALAGAQADPSQAETLALAWLCRGPIDKLGINRQDLTLDHVASAMRAWQGLELPPLLYLQSIDQFETPVLSPRSLARLAGMEVRSDVVWSTEARPCRSPTDDAWLDRPRFEDLTAAVNSQRNTDRAPGRQIAQARAVLHRLQDCEVSSDLPHEFCRVWLEMEMLQILDSHPAKNKVSSTCTRWSSLWPLWMDVPATDDPEQWTDQWATQIREWLTIEPSEEHPHPPDQDWQRQERVRDALTRMLSTLRRSGWDIPASAFEDLGVRSCDAPRVSASSSLPLDEDLEALDRSLRQELHDQPELRDLALLKLHLAAQRPLRSGEIMALPFGCMTEDGQLVLGPTKWAADKSGHAHRRVPLPGPLQDELRSVQESVGRLVHSTPDLFRAEPIHRQMVQEVRGLQEQLKRVMKDRDARFHSLRPAALMNLIWPGWLSIARSMVDKELTQADCAQWLDAVPVARRWTIAADAAVLAGHGAIEPSITSYLSNWPLIKTAWLSKLLPRGPIAESWYQLAGTSSAAYRQAKHRDTGPLDRWQWLNRRSAHAEVAVLFDDSPPGAAATQPEGPTCSDQQASAADELRYLALRLLSCDPAPARCATGLGLSATHRLDATATAMRSVAANARRRRRGGIDGRSNAADVKLLLDAEGVALTAWLAGMPAETAFEFDALLARDADAARRVGTDPMSAQPWKQICAGMPRPLSLQLRFGAGHLDAAQELALCALAPSVVLARRDRDLGRMPRVMVTYRTGGSSVAMARLTSVTRIICLARTTLLQLRK